VPHILIIDPDSELKADAVQRLGAAFPATRVIILTAITDEATGAALLRAGVAGYMPKHASAAELVESIRRVHRGGLYVHPSVAGKLFNILGRTEPDLDSLSTLSRREKQVLNELARGLSNKEIAIQLSLGDNTVKKYVSDILEKLDVRNRVEAAILCQLSPQISKALQRDPC
jgi:two-component system nitrate/nitrite response regulator NarL